MTAAAGLVARLVDPSSPGFRLGQLLTLLIGVGLALAVYTLPTLVAVQRRSTRTLGVVLIDFFLGWTVVGWVVALIMALASRTRPMIAPAVPAAPPSPGSLAAAPSAGTQPDVIEWTGGPPVKPAPHPADFARSAARVAILSIFAPPAYELWWLWQFFVMGRREGFPRARAFWWIFAPIYGFIVIYREFEDLEQRQPAGPRGSGFNAGAALALVIASSLAAVLSVLRADLTGLGLFLLSVLLFAGASFLVQRGANAYLAQKYPAEELRGMTWGELLAAALGILLFVLLAAGSMLPVDSGQSLL